MPHASIANSVF